MPAIGSAFPPEPTFHKVTVQDKLTSPSIGVSEVQQHAIPAVAGDTLTLLSATQELLNKTLNKAKIKDTDATPVADRILDVVDGLLRVEDLTGVEGRFLSRLSLEPITGAEIVDGAITDVKIADGAVTSAKIADGTIVDADISSTAAIAKAKISTAGTWAKTDLPTSVAYEDEANVFTADQLINKSAPKLRFLDTAAGAVELGLLADTAGQLLAVDAAGVEARRIRDTSFLGSGTVVPSLNADLLDGLHEADFGRLAVARTWTAEQTFNAGVLLGDRARLNPPDLTVTRNFLSLLVGAEANERFLLRMNTAGEVEILWGPGGAVAPTETFRIKAGQAYRDPFDNGSVTATTFTVDWDNAPIQKLTLGASITLSWANVAAGKRLILLVKQDATGGRTITWPASILWEGGLAPTLTATPNKTDVLAFWSDGVNEYGSVYGLNY